MTNKLKQTIMRLMREDFDPRPKNWNGGDWNDNAEDVADQIIASLGDGMAIYGRLREANRERQAEWDPNSKITPSFRGNELAGEVGEACNVIKKIERERLGIRGSRATIGDLAKELADIVTCVDLIAMDFNIDLDKTVRDTFNAVSERYGLKTRIV